MRFLLVLLAGLLSACTVTLEGLTLTYRLDLTPAILRFEPDRGTGATYFVGEEVRFFLTLESPGWVSLVVQDPDGHTYELDRFYLPRGTHVLPPGAYRYVLTPPRGLHRVRAVYTDTEPGALRLEGVYTDWDARLRVYLEASRARRYQVAETHFYVR
ncbi:protein of unknown function [Thermus arciformis]|uniref:DUF4384 domain-containing protein n=1 Tax=Thermus arciformis TaxID=482827 RepID=A0A1G7IBW2_9DEIN|nr:DUF4384 domain-containing protein [Thermus arciformis]SDF10113.1 protein of unknown function [Thermus arciformis]